MKYNVPNDDLSLIDEIEKNIIQYFSDLAEKYTAGRG